MKTLIKLIGSVVAVLTLALTVSAADTAKGGGKKLTELNTPAQVTEVEKGDLVVTACPKCKTVVHTRVKTTAKGGGLGKEKVATHGCPGCGAQVDLTGHGKAKVDKITHTCSHCGSSEAFCSVLKKKDAD
ncbi:MAG TPA: hypothetical protein VF773_10970 [Verrucomicrobiae bacterium]